VQVTACAFPFQFTAFTRSFTKHQDTQNLSKKPTARNPSSEGKKSPVSQHNADVV